MALTRTAMELWMNAMTLMDSQDWDLGHARVAAGLVEKRPHTAVEHADVTFEPTDL